jgi:hypothetical protein
MQYVHCLLCAQYTLYVGCMQTVRYGQAKHCMHCALSLLHSLNTHTVHYVRA